MTEQMNYEKLRGHLNDALAELEHLLFRDDLVEINEGLRCTAGRYGDVYKATLRRPDTGANQVVAVKELRAVGDDVARIRLAIHLTRELRVWSRLNHPNILELIGYCLNPQMTTARFISPFMTNGNIDEYLENAPSPVSDNLRLKLLRDSLNGLVYLHSLDPPICHADIKPGNVLITDLVEAVLCDFGLARLADGQPSGLTTTKTIKGSTRYMSPELLEEDAVHTLSSDIWAYGCLVLKVMTGSLPYNHARTDQKVILALAQKQPPAELADSEFQANKLKELLVKCWDTKPLARPPASECRLHLPITGRVELQQPRNHHQNVYQPSSLSVLDGWRVLDPSLFDFGPPLPMAVPPLQSDIDEASTASLASLSGFREPNHFYGRNPAVGLSKSLSNSIYNATRLGTIAPPSKLEASNPYNLLPAPQHHYLTTQPHAYERQPISTIVGPRRITDEPHGTSVQMGLLGTNRSETPISSLNMHDFGDDNVHTSPRRSARTTPTRKSGARAGGALEKNFACRVCGLKFARNHDLARHHKVHDPVKCYRCRGCDRSFTRREALKRHNTQKNCGSEEEHRSLASGRQQETTQRSRDSLDALPGVIADFKEDLPTTSDVIILT